MNKKDCINIIKEYFINREDISTVYLFGSVAKNRATKGSDVDIAILFTEDLPLLDRFDRKLEIANDLEDLLKLKIDVVDLETADPYFIHQVMLGKEIILDKNTERRVSFEVKKREEYFDRKYFYDLYYNQALKRLEEKGRKYHNG